ncbi:MAG: carboxypeptidase-like regulatory domain-containing protein, partial [Planctomycetota bacterium]
VTVRPDPDSGLASWTRGSLLKLDEPALRVDVSLQRGAIVAGRVVDSDGVAVGEGMVRLYRRVGRGMRWVADASIDGLGGYRFHGLNEGSYGIEAWTAGAARRITRNVRSSPVETAALRTDFQIAENRSEQVLPDLKVTPTGVVAVRVGGLGYRAGLRPEQQALAPIWLSVGSTLLRGWTDTSGTAYFYDVPARGRVRAWGPGHVAGAEPVPASPEFEVAAGRLTVARVSETFESTIRARVHDSDGSPIPGASAAVFGASAPDLWKTKVAWRFTPGHDVPRTDRFGNTEIRIPSHRAEELTDGWVLVVFAPGFVRNETKVLPLQREADVTVTLDRGARVRGRVTGVPPGLRVYLTRHHETFYDVVIEARCEPDGTFDVDGLEPGEYEFCVYAGDRSGPTVSATAPVSDLVLRWVPESKATETISGRLVSKEGPPIRYAGVRLEGRGGERVYANTDADGRWSARVTPGTYELRVAPNQTATRFSRTKRGKVEAGTKGLVIELATSQRDLVVLVENEDQEPVAGALVVPRSTAVDSWDHGYTMPFQGSGAGGRVRFKEMPPQYDELLLIADGYVPRAVAIGWKDTQTVVLSREREVAGTIQRANGRPADSLHVALVPADEDTVSSESRLDTERNGAMRTRVKRALQRTSRTDAEGAFRFGKLDRGSYWVLVAGDPSEAALPRRVRVGEALAPIRLLEARTVRGRVTGSKSKFVRVLWNGIEVARVTPDASGDFEVSGLVAAEPYEVRCAAVRVTVPPHETNVQLDVPASR